MARMLLFLALLPVLVLGSASGAMGLWLHSHGPTGGHVHLVPPHADPLQLGSLHERHDARHHHEHEHEHDHEPEHEHEGEPPDGEDEDHPAPRGLVIELPPVLAATPKSSNSSAAASTPLPSMHPVRRWHVAVQAIEHRPDRCRYGGPPQRARRSGVAELLRGSHALLI